MSQSEDKKQRFCELLRSTGRENIEYVIEDLDTYGFLRLPHQSVTITIIPEGLLNILSMCMTPR